MWSSPSDKRVFNYSSLDQSMGVFVPHQEIPNFQFNDADPIDEAVLDYEAARNSGSVAAHYEELVRKARARQFYAARRARHLNKPSPKEVARQNEARLVESTLGHPEVYQAIKASSANDDPPPSGINQALEYVVNQAYDQLSSNRFRALAYLTQVPEDDPVADVDLTFSNARDARWRSTRRRKLPVLHKHKAILSGTPDQEPPVPGVIVYTPSHTGKTQYLARMKMTAVQVSDNITSVPELTSALLGAGFLISTSNPHVLKRDHPTISLLPGSLPERYIPNRNHMAITHVRDYRIALDNITVNSVLYSKPLLR